MFTTEFDQYVCPGDTIRCEVDGVVYTARLAYDQDARPQDDDWYSAEEIDAWSRDEWAFYGVIIAASKGGIELDSYAASLWGIAGNFGNEPGRNAHFLEAANELLEEAQKEAKAAIERMVTALAA